jgi:GDP-L-fucose synthase
MKILVTGATGFLGRALCPQLEAQGHEVVALNSRNCDLTKEESLNFFNHSVYEQIYHLAAWTQAGDFCLFHPGEQWIINQKINTNVLTWWHKYQPQAKLIAMGSSCAYDPEYELVEDNYLVGTPIESLFTYAMTKRMLYAGLIALNKQFALKYLYLVPSTLYGPGYHTDGRQMHFIFDLIRKILRGKVCGDPVILWGDGHQKREVVFIDDFVKVAIELGAVCDNEVVNVGAGEEFTIQHFAERISRMVGYDSRRIEFDAARYVGAKSKCLVIKKLQGLISDAALTPLDAGLERTIEWFSGERETLI